MSVPDILALDFDGVLCDGMREYFETSRRTYARIWPHAPSVGDELFAAFRDLRPVITSGWEMPVLLRAIVERRPHTEILSHWSAVRDPIVASMGGAAIAKALTDTLDRVRREWLAADPKGWLELHRPYSSLDELRRVLAEPERAILVTTKEGEFARRILDHWAVSLADIQGKEAGSHKCDNVRAAIASYTATRGRPPLLWFVEDRLETLEHVTTHADLEDVGLFLAAWGYNTGDARATARADRRIRLLDLERFTAGVGCWQ